MLTPNRLKIGKSLARRSGSSFARHSMTNSLFRQGILKQIMISVRREMKGLCKKDSIFTMNLKTALETFTWEHLLGIIRSIAPILFSVVSAALTRSRSEPPTLPLLAILCLIMKTRSQRMSLLQRLISLIMYAGHAGKQVSKCNML